VTPLIFPGAKADDVAQDLIFAALVASYDLLLGYTGWFVRAHRCLWHRQLLIAIALYSMDRAGGGRDRAVVGLRWRCCWRSDWTVLVAGRGVFFAMITLAVASAFLVLDSQLSWLTGGEDGRSFQLPDCCGPARC